MAAFNQCDGASNCVGIAEGDNSYFYFLKTSSTSGSKTVGGNEGKFKNGVYIKCHQGINDYDNCSKDTSNILGCDCAFLGGGTTGKKSCDLTWAKNNYTPNYKCSSECNTIIEGGTEKCVSIK